MKGFSFAIAHIAAVEIRRKGKTPGGVAFKETTAPRFRQENSRADIISSRSNLFGVVSARNLYSTRSQGPCIIGLSQRGDRKATRSALSSLCTRVYVVTSVYIYLCECVWRRCSAEIPAERVRESRVVTKWTESFSHTIFRSCRRQLNVFLLSYLLIFGFVRNRHAYVRMFLAIYVYSTKGREKENFMQSFTICKSV